MCTVAGYIGEFKFGNGGTSKHTYALECEGHYYPARHMAVANALADPAVRRRTKKAPPPRLLRAK